MTKVNLNLIPLSSSVQDKLSYIKYIMNIILFENIQLETQ